MYVQMHWFQGCACIAANKAKIECVAVQGGCLPCSHITDATPTQLLTCEVASAMCAELMSSASSPLRLSASAAACRLVEMTPAHSMAVAYNK